MLVLNNDQNFNNFLIRENEAKKKNMDTYHGHRGFSGDTVVKNLSANAGDARDADSIPGWEELLE